MRLQWGRLEKTLIAEVYQTFLMYEGWEQGFMTTVPFTLQASSHPADVPNLRVQSGAGYHCREPGFTPTCLLYIHILRGQGSSSLCMVLSSDCPCFLVRLQHHSSHGLISVSMATQL